MHGMVFKPPNFDPGRKYPTVLFVYGGPAVQVSFIGFRASQKMNHNA